MLLRLRSIWRDALALLFAIRDPRTPAGARGLALVALIYAVSPIDLLPDTLPGLGVMDDLLIVPTLLALAARQLPASCPPRCWPGRVAAAPFWPPAPPTCSRARRWWRWGCCGAWAPCCGTA